MFLKLTCPRCQKAFPLTEEDAALFFPQVCCLACGAKMPLPLTPDEHLALVRKRDRNRRLEAGTQGSPKAGPAGGR